MAHAQKPDFIFQRNGRVHLNRRWASVHSTTGSRGVRISGSNAGYTMFRGSVKSTGYPLHYPVSPSLPLLCVTVCHHISTGLFQWNKRLIPTDVSLRTTKESQDKTRPQIGRRNTRTSVAGNLPMGEPHPENCYYLTNEPLKI